jgi:putative endopeptidase
MTGDEYFKRFGPRINSTAYPQARGSMLRSFALLVQVAASAPALLQAQTAHPAPAAAVDTAGMDRSVKPGDNFFAYANGHWLATT